MFVCVDFLKARIAKFLLFKDNCEFWSIECACHEKSVLGILTHFMYVLMMGSECRWSFGEDANPFTKGPQILLWALSIKQRE